MWRQQTYGGPVISYEWRGGFASEEVSALHAEWLHVDFEDHLRPFYLGSCGFRPAQAGLIAL